MELQFSQFWPIINKTISLRSAQAVLELAAEGGTVPFIARYRKEKTGNLDEVQIRDVIEANDNMIELNKRRIFVVKEIETQGNLSDELKKRIELCYDLGELEEIYRPFKKKKKTKATIARDAGLEPLANWIWALGHGELKDDMSLEVKAKDSLNVAAGFATYDLVLKGAQDIIVEKISNDPALRETVRVNYFDHGGVVSKVGKAFKPHSKFEMYKEFAESVKSLQEPKSSHRYLAMRRGWAEDELAVTVMADDDYLQKKFENFAVSEMNSQASEFLKLCAKTALTVHVTPSIVNEVHRLLKDKADLHSILVFAENVRKVLLGSPFGPKCVLGVDPGLRTGSKLALIDKQGNFISNTVLMIHGDGAEKKAKTLFTEVMKQIKIEAIAVGNGTAGRETETFLRKIVKEIAAEQTAAGAIAVTPVPVILVSESGASIYSASDIAREEFPNLDLTIRGAISIARRLQDPLAELVKVDPKSIGVGQYQHDVSQPALKKSLDAVVESCVNGVGVDLNTASAPLLSYVSGIGPALAKNLVEHRKTNGLFKEREELLKVPRFSAKIYEQCAGFLRIQGGKSLLDQTGVHPERYPAIRDMAGELEVPVSQLVGEGAKKLLNLRTKWCQLVGEYTFDDIVRELEKPGRDPRDAFTAFTFREDIYELKDLQVAMICPGIVTNVTNFGAFVDIGVHQDGLVHISELSHKFIDDPRKVVNPGDQVKVKVLAVDQEKKQISLSMLLEPRPAMQARPEAQDRGQGREMSAGGGGGRGGARPGGDRSGGRPSERTAGQGGGAGARAGGGGDSRGPRSGGSLAGASSGGARGASGNSSRPGGGDRGPRGDNRNSGSGGRPNDNRGGRDGGRDSQDRAPRSISSGMGGSPFNNPFAALLKK
jgi:protein Tex